MKQRRKIMVLAIVFSCGLVLGPPGTQAALVTIQIEAVVDSVWDDGNYLEGKIKVGDVITGWYSYDSSTRDTNPLQNGGRYQHTTAPHGMYFAVGGFLFETNPGNVDSVIEIENDHPPDDNYFLLSRNNLALSNGVVVDYISWLLHDPSGNALTGDALPTTAPLLDDWETNRLRFEADRKYGISAHVTSAIPEPSTIILLSLSGLILRKRREY